MAFVESGPEVVGEHRAVVEFRGGQLLDGQAAHGLREDLAIHEVHENWWGVLFEGDEFARLPRDRWEIDRRSLIRQGNPDRMSGLS